LHDRYSARRGTYRVIYRIDDDLQQVSVVGVLAARMHTVPMNGSAHVDPFHRTAVRKFAASCRIGQPSTEFDEKETGQSLWL